MSSEPSSKPEGSTAPTSAPAPAKAAPKAASPTTVTPESTKPGLEVKKPETADDKIARAKAVNDRFKRRGKRTAAAVDPSSTTEGDSSTPASKKAKSQSKDTTGAAGMGDEYLREVQGYMARSLKDEGAGKRPLVR